MVKQYYEAAEDKTAVLKELIEFDYQDSTAVNHFVDQLGFFDRPVAAYLAEFEARRPRITHTTGVANGAEQVSSGKKTITFHFSRPMHPYFRSTDYGPLGEEVLPKIEEIAMATDSNAVTYTVMTEPARQYQFTLGSSYRTADGVRLIPYTIDFKTK
ncbi:MAG: hypothetical protein AAF840_07485, partial [Bacteroidota bacterium]